MTGKLEVNFSLADNSPSDRLIFGCQWPRADTFYPTGTQNLNTDALPPESTPVTRNTGHLSAQMGAGTLLEE